MTMYVRDNTLTVYLDGRHILSTDSHFQSRQVTSHSIYCHGFMRLNNMESVPVI